MYDYLYTCVTIFLGSTSVTGDTGVTGDISSFKNEENTRIYILVISYIYKISRVK